jgi:hypothetical protein
MEGEDDDGAREVDLQFLCRKRAAAASRTGARSLTAVRHESEMRALGEMASAICRMTKAGPPPGACRHCQHPLLKT